MESEKFYAIAVRAVEKCLGSSSEAGRGRKPQGVSERENVAGKDGSGIDAIILMGPQDGEVDREGPRGRAARPNGKGRERGSIFKYPPGTHLTVLAKRGRSVLSDLKERSVLERPQKINCREIKVRKWTHH